MNFGENIYTEELNTKRKFCIFDPSTDSLFKKSRNIGKLIKKLEKIIEIDTKNSEKKIEYKMGNNEKECYTPLELGGLYIDGVIEYILRSGEYKITLKDFEDIITGCYSSYQNETVRGVVCLLEFDGEKIDSRYSPKRVNKNLDRIKKTIIDFYSTKWILNYIKHEAE